LFEENPVESGESLNQVIASIEPETLNHLKQLYIDAQKDIDRFKVLVENWFDETMERTTGWYKRQTQWILLFIGFVLAVVFNVDTIAIGNILSKDKTARENLVQLAINSAPKYDSAIQRIQRKSITDTTVIKDTANKADTTANVIIRDTVTVILNNDELSTAYSTVKSDIDKASNILGLGWPNTDSCEVCDSIKKEIVCCTNDTVKKAALNRQLQYYNSTFNCSGNPYQKGGFNTFLGWLITALAISLGAPFWFDLLNKIIQLRSSVAKPKQADTGGGSSKIDDSSSSHKRVG
jgi:hypothetical protein